MSKYIIEIAKEYEDTTKGVMVLGARESNLYVDTLAVENLEELNSDYINEHYGELQDEAYKRGYEDGKDSAEKGCEGCKYESVKEGEPPCRACSKAYKNRYTPAPHSDRIEVGDEVVWNDGTTLTVTRVYKLDDDEWCDGMDEDGRMYGVLKNNVRKTGKHYDIASILEAMRS